MKKTIFFKSLNFGTLALALALLIGFSACTENDSVSNDLMEDEATAFEDEQDVDEELDGISEVLTAFTDLDNLEGGRVNSTDTLPPDSSYLCVKRYHLRDENTIIIDYGDGCVGLDGVFRAGQIIITYTGHYLVPGTVITKTFRNYYVNDHKVEGLITLTNISTTPNSFPTFNLTLEGGKFTWDDGTFALRESNFTWTWINSANPLYDEFHKDGAARGSTRRGIDYGVEILSTLVRKKICKLEGVHIPVQGIKQVSIEGRQTFTIDYGEGECDNAVTITREDGESRTIDNFRRFKRRRG